MPFLLRLRLLLGAAVLAACSGTDASAAVLDAGDGAAAGDGDDASNIPQNDGSMSCSISLSCEGEFCSACSGRGSCDDGQCACQAGYAGEVCEACAAGFHVAADGQSCTSAFCDPNPCGEKQSCDEGPRRCCPAGTCASGQRQCANGALRSCIADVVGCGAWGPMVSCGETGCADDTACASGVPGLVIDQWGTTGVDAAFGATAGRDGHCIIAGVVGGPFAGQPHQGVNSTDILVRDGKTGSWNRTLGTLKTDRGSQVRVAPDGSLVVAGTTDAQLGQEAFRDRDVVLARYGADLELLRVTQWGSQDFDNVQAMELDAAGNAFVTGYTHGNMLDPHAAHDGSIYVSDSFLSKVSAEGGVQWTVQWGSTGQEAGLAVRVDGQGYIYVAGTNTGAGGQDAYVRKFDGAGQEVWTAVLGGAGRDQARDLQLLEDGSVLAVGWTGSGFEGSEGGGAFIAWISAAGAVDRVELFGTTASDIARCVVLGEAGAFYVIGETYGDLGAENAGKGDIYIQKRGANGAPLFTKQFGTPADEYVDGAARLPDGTLCLAGATRGSFPGFVHAGLQDGITVLFKE